MRVMAACYPDALTSLVSDVPSIHSLTFKDPA